MNIDVFYTQVYKDEITVTCSDLGTLYTSLPHDQVRSTVTGHVVYINGTRWVVEDCDRDSVFLRHDPS